MPVNAIGMKTHRDSFAIAFDAQTLETHIKDMISPALTDDEIVNRYGCFL